MAGSWIIQINTRLGDPISPRFWMFFTYTKLLGRTEMRTRDRMYCRSIRTVRDICRDDRARIATCSLLPPTDLTLWPPGRLLTALSIFPRSAFDGFYLQMSLSHGYLLRIRINQVREVSIVYCQWIVIAYGIPFH